MSNSSRTDRSPLPGELPSVPAVSDLRKPLAGMAFWTAIALPFLYLPLLATGLESQTTALAFMTLVVLNVVALLVGHSYRRD